MSTVGDHGKITCIYSGKVSYRAFQFLVQLGAATKYDMQVPYFYLHLGCLLDEASGLVYKYLDENDEMLINCYPHSIDKLTIIIILHAHLFLTFFN